MRVHKLREDEWIIAQNFRRATTEPGGAGLTSRACDSVPIFDSWSERYGWQDQNEYAMKFSTEDAASDYMLKNDNMLTNKER